MWMRHGVESKAGQTWKAWLPRGFVLVFLLAKLFKPDIFCLFALRNELLFGGSFRGSPRRKTREG